MNYRTQCDNPLANAGAAPTAASCNAGPSEQFVTRKQALGKLINLGYPITESYWNKINLPSVGAGPAVDKWFGKRPLYFMPNVIAWAESRCSSTRSKLVA